MGRTGAQLAVAAGTGPPLPFARRRRASPDFRQEAERQGGEDRASGPPGPAIRSVRGAPGHAVKIRLAEQPDLRFASIPRLA